VHAADASARAVSQPADPLRRLVVALAKQAAREALASANRTLLATEQP
jgi:hypothetical protein